MAEGELNYDSVRFKANKVFPPEAEKEEESVYNEVKVQSESNEKTADTNAKKEERTVCDNVKEQTETTKQTADINVSAGLFPVKKTNSRGRRYQQVACCLGILCIILLLGIIGFCVYVATFSHESEQKQLKENQTILLALIHNLTNLNNKLSSENENMMKEHNNLTVQLNNLTQANTVLKSKMTNLSAENQNLTSQNYHLSAENQNLTSQNMKLSAENQNLTSRNQKLETQRNNLTEQIRIMEKNWNELNVSRAQWSIDAYCPKENQNRQCEACQTGWIRSESSCYAIINTDASGQKTWQEAREDCRGKISDLVVRFDQKETKYVNFPWDEFGYWIGLRVEAGNWTWINGTFLNTPGYWTESPSAEANCTISIGGTHSKRWKAVKCDETHRWICEKKALSV